MSLRALVWQQINRNTQLLVKSNECCSNHLTSERNRETEIGCLDANVADLMRLRYRSIVLAVRAKQCSSFNHDQWSRSQNQHTSACLSVVERAALKTPLPIGVGMVQQGQSIKHNVSRGWFDNRAFADYRSRPLIQILQSLL